MPTDPSTSRFDFNRRRILALSGVSITALAGCGSSDDDSDPEPDTPDGGDGSDGTDSDGSDGSDGDGGETEEEQDEGEATFELVGVTHPDEVATGEAHTYSIEVENTGDATGDFEETLEGSYAGQDGWENLGIITLEAVGPGETATWESDEFVFENPGTPQYRIGDTEWEYDVTITEPSEQSFSGSGQSVESGIDIDGGLVVLEATHDGEGNFQVSLEDDSEFGESFINVIGSFDGAQAELVDAGEYLLEVNADGNWGITIRQPRTGQGDNLPTTIAGSGPQVSDPIRFGGTGIATGDHDGESNFQVQIYPMTGSFGESVFNEIGEFDGETTFSFDGVGWVDINADGSWSVEFE